MSAAHDLHLLVGSSHVTPRPTRFLNSGSDENLASIVRFGESSASRPRHEAERVECGVGLIVVTSDIRRHAVLAQPSRQAAADFEIRSRHVEIVGSRLWQVDILADVKRRAQRAVDVPMRFVPQGK